MTSMLARMNDMMFSHMIGWPSWAYAIRSLSTPVSTRAMITISEVM